MDESMQEFVGESPMLLPCPTDASQGVERFLAIFLPTQMKTQDEKPADVSSLLLWQPNDSTLHNQSMQTDPLQTYPTNIKIEIKEETVEAFGEESCHSTFTSRESLKASCPPKEKHLPAQLETELQMKKEGYEFDNRDTWFADHPEEKVSSPCEWIHHHPNSEFSFDTSLMWDDSCKQLDCQEAPANIKRGPVVSPEWNLQNDNTCVYMLPTIPLTRIEYWYTGKINPCLKEEPLKPLTDNNLYKCKICNHIFNCESSLLQHEESNHIKNKKYLCTICNSCCSSKINFEIHVIKKHKDLNGKSPLKMICGSNSKQVVKKKQINKPIRHNCKLCKKSYATKTGLENHLLSFHQKRRFLCTICKLKWSKKYSFTKHVAKFHKNLKEDLPLEIVFDCIGNSGTTNNMNHGDLNSIKSERVNKPIILKKTRDCYHGIKLTKPCSVKLVKMGINFLLPLKYGDKKQLFVCKHCEKSFAQKEILLAHAKTHVQAIKYVCNVCNTGLFSKAEAENHVWLTHDVKNSTKVRLFSAKIHMLSCTMCSFKTESKNYLDDHIFQHRVQSRSQNNQSHYIFRRQMCDI